jgi:RimJ/RimL family protein N-acetyltransferase
MAHDDAAAALLEIWPIVGVRIRTPRLELRPVDGEHAVRVAALAADGIHDAASMPFLVPWTDVAPPEQQRESLRHFWSTWSTFRVDSWSLPLAVIEGGEVVGVQAVHRAEHFPQVRTAETGSWLGRRFQGRGIGTEMREAVLHLLFAGLDAREALSGAFVDNPASIAVSRKLGNLDNGTRWVLRRDAPAEQLLFRLPREHWLERRRDDIAIEGLDARCLSFLGLG